MGGMQVWRSSAGPDPNVTHNPTTSRRSGHDITWAPGQFALHPGPKGEYSVARWTAPADGEQRVSANFAGIAQKATTDVHVLHNGKPLFDDFINLNGHGNGSAFSKTLTVRGGDTIDFVVGFGNGHYGGDTTALAATINDQN